MNFLSNTFNQLTGNAIPYNFQDEVCTIRNWKVYNGTSKATNQLVSIFEFDTVKNSHLVEYCQCTMKNWKQLKLPGIVNVLETIELSSKSYIVTERVAVLDLNDNSSTNEIKYLVLNSVAIAMNHVNKDAKQMLGNLTVFTTSCGEFKIGLLDFLTNLEQQDSQSSLFKYRQLNDSELPPELANDIFKLKNRDFLKFDSFIFGRFLNRLFNNKLPNDLVSVSKKLLNDRIPVSKFLELGEGSFFNRNLIIVLNNFKHFKLINETEKKMEILHSFELVFNDLPAGFAANSLLPELITFFNQNTVVENQSVLLKLIFSYSAGLNEAQYTRLVTPVIFKAFSVPDRAIRICLLLALPNYLQYLKDFEIRDKIFPFFITGFTDSNQLIINESIKKVLLLAPKLSDRQLNNELLRFLAKTQSDQNVETRINTTICICKIASHLNQQSRATVLSTAFAKALKDPNVDVRLTSLLSLINCIEYFTPEIICSKILSVIAPNLLDKDRKVRVQAQLAFNMFFDKINAEIKKLPSEDGSEGEQESVEKISALFQNFDLNSNPEAALPLGSSKIATPPVLSRSVTPVVLNTGTQAKPSSFGTSWDDTDDIQIDDDDWGADEDVDVDVPAPVPIAKPIAKPVAKPKPASKPTTTPATKPKGLQLKPKSAKSKLKLNLDLSNDDDGSWGDDSNW